MRYARFNWIVTYTLDGGEYKSFLTLLEILVRFFQKNKNDFKMENFYDSDDLVITKTISGTPLKEFIISLFPLLP